jgi:hypothetical protein
MSEAALAPQRGLRVLWARIHGGRIPTIVATVVVGTVLVGSSALIPGGPGGSVVPPGDGEANLWVDSTGGTCTRQSPAGAYSDAAACSSFGVAYQAAASGDLVLIRPGGYGSQTLNVATPNKTSAVTFEPETEDTVTVTSLAILAADWVHIKGINNTTTQSPFFMDDVGNVCPCPDNNTFEDIEAAWWDMRSAPGTGNKVIGGDYGPCLADASNDCLPRALGVNVLVDGVTFHDLTSSNATLYHPDGLFIRGCVGCIVRNSTFYNNQITNIRIQNCCTLPDVSNLQIYNNWFAVPWSNANLTGFRHDGIDVDNQIPNLVIAFNSFSSSCDGGGSCGQYIGGVSSSLGTAGSPALVYGNLIGRSGCQSNATFSYNVYRKFSVFTGSQCGPTEVLSPSAFPYTTDPNNAGASNFNITGAAWLGDNVVPLSLCDDYPSDRNGAPRTGGSFCDAGSVER